MNPRNLIAAVSFLAPASGLVAGPLNPPAGQVTSTFKTLTEVEPRIAINAANTPGDADSLYRITAPGSYYLAGNIQGVTGKSGIEIATNNVTIDLNGFVVLGTTGSLSGIAGANREGTVVRGGTIRAWGIHGIDLSFGNGCQVSDVLLEYAAQRGLVTGYYGRVDRVTARGCNGTGLVAGRDAVFTGCVAAENWVGMDIGASSQARDCMAAYNISDGFNSTGSAPIFEGCTAMSNGGDGFEAGADARVEGCVARYNGDHGIHLVYHAVALNNLCALNGAGGDGAGIYLDADTQRSRIEGNFCSDNDFGIKVDGTYNLVVGNRCTVNTTNFEIVANNRVGPIVVLPLSGAISGNSGGAGSTDPISNLAH